MPENSKMSNDSNRQDKSETLVISEKTGAAIISLKELFLSFFTLGATAFGGPAIIHFIYKMAVEEKKWISKEDGDRGIAVSQTLPGVISMQMAAYIGYKIRGFSGAFACYAGMGLPAFLIMLLLSVVYAKTRNSTAVASAFHGLHGIIVAMMFFAAYSFGKKNLKKPKDIILGIITFLMFWFRVHPAIAIFSSGIIGMIIFKNFGASKNLPKPGNNSAPPNSSNTKNLLTVFFAAVLAALIYLTAALIDANYLKIMSTMSRIALMAFGGGFTSVPLMLHAVVDSNQWLKEPVFMDGMALGQITPGPFVITATFVGYMVYGIPGAVFSTLGIFIPPFLLVLFIVPYFDKLSSSPYFNSAIKGILCSFVGLLLVVSIKLAVKIDWDTMLVLISLATFIGLFYKVSLIRIVLIGTILSFVYYNYIF